MASLRWLGQHFRPNKILEITNGKQKNMLWLVDCLSARLCFLLAATAIKHIFNTNEWKTINFQPFAASLPKYRLSLPLGKQGVDTEVLIPLKATVVGNGWARWEMSFTLHAKWGIWGGWRGDHRLAERCHLDTPPPPPSHNYFPNLRCL